MTADQFQDRLELKDKKEGGQFDRFTLTYQKGFFGSPFGMKKCFY